MQSLLDAAGHHRSPATMPGYHRGRPPRNKGEQYLADPPSIEEIIEVMRTAGDNADGQRLRALIVILWRAGLRISEALALQESDLDHGRGAILVRRGKGGKRREVGMDRWAFTQLNPWLETRQQLPVGAFLCVIHGATAGRHWEASAVQTTPPCGACSRCAPALRAASITSRSRRRDGARRRPARRHPTTTRAREPRDHLYLPPRHRQRGDHQHRPPTTITNDLRQRRTTPQAINRAGPPGRPFPAGPEAPRWRIRGLSWNGERDVLLCLNGRRTHERRGVLERTKRP
jgi:integrase